MTSILNLVETALYSKLSTDTAIASIVGARIYDTQAPDNATTPYIIFQHVSGGDENSSPRRDFTVRYRIECVSTVQSQARNVAGLIDAALHEQELTIAGWSNYRCEATDLFNRVDVIDLTAFYRKGSFYKISADQDNS